jgi:hypothetical protein
MGWDSTAAGRRKDAEDYGNAKTCFLFLSVPENYFSFKKKTQ